MKNKKTKTFLKSKEKKNYGNYENAKRILQNRTD